MLTQLWPRGRPRNNIIVPPPFARRPGGGAIGPSKPPDEKNATSHTHTHRSCRRRGGWLGIARAACRDRSAGWRWRGLDAPTACPPSAVKSHGGTREWTETGGGGDRRTDGRHTGQS
ncbi:hypothetical protein JOB18_030629 [Solea senegalensis]|uniref:Uncharacterized protein n=1 Tax=Solea senegalensis TaxID=28829 RepID=A0AAV6RTD6_SOLSE|nr:hypothetical protein JOB18_030629 [Solea senegalensis]